MGSCSFLVRVRGLEQLHTRPLKLIHKRGDFGAVPFCCALDERIPQAEPKTAVGFCITNYPRKKAQDPIWDPVLFGAGKRT